MSFVTRFSCGLYHNVVISVYSEVSVVLCCGLRRVLFCGFVCVFALGSVELSRARFCVAFGCDVPRVATQLCFVTR